MRVFHDPGHGGDNRGCKYNGIVEKDWNLDFCLSLPGDHELSREVDLTSSYTARANDAKVYGADIVLCHHVNAITDSVGVPLEKFDGLMAFAYPGDAVSNAVANVIARCAPERLLQKKRLAATRGWPAHVTSSSNWTSRAHSVLSAYRNKGLTAVLIEWGFATSPGDADYLKSSLALPAMYATIAAGVGRAHELLKQRSVL